MSNPTTTPKKDLEFRIDHLTEKLFEYVYERERLMLLNQQLTQKCEDQRKMLFLAAGHVSSVKEPTPWGMMFSTDIYRAICTDVYRTREYEEEQVAKMWDLEARAGLAATVETRQQGQLTRQLMGERHRAEQRKNRED